MTGYWPTVNVDPPELPMLDCDSCGELEELCVCTVQLCGTCGRPLGDGPRSCHDELVGGLLLPAHWIDR